MLHEPKPDSQRTYPGHHEQKLDDLAALATKRSPEDLLERTLAAAREHLGMDVAFVAEFSEDRLEFRSIEGDAQSFGLQEDSGVPLESSYCRRLVAGLIPNVIPDARSNSHVKDLEATRDAQIGAYVGVPLRFSDGRVYGTFCCVNHSPEPSLRARDAGFVKVLARLVSEQLEREELEKRNQLLETRAAGADALVAALEARDGYTGEHSMAVVELSESVARSLGFPEEEIEDLKHAALLHDVGKMGIPDSVLGKQGPLEEWEWEVMKQHPEIGERIVASLQSLEHLAPVVRAEHERWDGKGYPDSLSGTEIPLPSRIVLACDALHAMTSDRPYREAMELPEALEELKMEAGKQFDPRVVQALIAVVEN